MGAAWALKQRLTRTRKGPMAGASGNDIMPLVGGSREMNHQPGSRHMSIVKVIEVIAESPKSWDDAAGQALKEVARTVDGIVEIWVSGMKAIVENNKIVRYRITANVSFEVKGREKE
jgi:flavin-binding protein dodecin